MGAFTYTLANVTILAGWVLLLVASISAPVINQISFLDVAQGGDQATFGVFGYCSNAENDQCSGTGVGYDISRAASQFAGANYNNNAVDRASNALILHPIAAGIAFLAQIIALASNQFGFLCASFIVFLAFLVSLVCMVLDFALFGIVRNAINGNVVGSPASFGNATWITLGATASLLISVIFTLFACCCGGDRRSSRRYGKGYNDGGYVGNAPGMTQTSYAPQRRHWWSRR